MPPAATSDAVFLDSGKFHKVVLQAHLQGSLSMHGNRQPNGGTGLGENVVTTVHPLETPAVPFQEPAQLAAR